MTDTVEVPNPPASDDNVGGTLPLLVVGTWNVASNNKPVPAGYDYINYVNPKIPFINKQRKTYQWLANSKQDVPLGQLTSGQGGVNAPVFFNNHFVVQITLNKTDYYFDPSYGVFYQANGGLDAYQNLIVSSFQFVANGALLKNGKQVVEFETIKGANLAATQANIAAFIIQNPQQFQP